MLNTLKALLPFCDKTPPPSKPYLAGMLFEFAPWGVTLVAMSMHKGITASLEVAHGNAEGDRVLVHNAEIKRMIEYLEGKEGPITLAATDASLLVMRGPSMDGDFFAMEEEGIDWRRVFDLEGADPVPDAVLFDPTYLEAICKAFKALSETKESTTELIPCGQLVRSVFTLLPSHCRAGVSDVAAVLMPKTPTP